MDADAKRLVIVEDDARFARTLARSFERRGYDVRACPDIAALEALIADWRPAFAVVDLKLGTTSGLVAVRALAALDPAPRIVVLTGYASISTAVEAIKLGATGYLPKPANTDDVEAAFGRVEGNVGEPIGVKRVRPGLEIRPGWLSAL